MTALSNDQGRAFEYITLLALKDNIINIRCAEIEYNSSYYAAKRAWDNIDESVREKLRMAAYAAVETIFEFEPLILEDGDDVLTLLIQNDSQGEIGDVRDILIIRRNIHWEIGLSLKHNHFAVKHSRLAKNLDFGYKWFGIPCSDEYWRDVSPIFNYLEREKNNGLNWRDLPSKEDDVYVPLLNAFMNEIIRSNRINLEVPKKMVEYLLGEYDFYKVISVDAKRMTEILSFNLKGTLNLPSRNKLPERSCPITNLPTRIVDIEFKPNSKNTVELYMNNGWQFSFRIHNASSKVETSLKFDIQIVGMPTTIITVNCNWN